jgi:hypothetical protein
VERLKPVYDYLNGKYNYNDIALTRLFILWTTN